MAGNDELSKRISGIFDRAFSNIGKMAEEFYGLGDEITKALDDSMKELDAKKWAKTDVQPGEEKIVETTETRPDGTVIKTKTITRKITELTIDGKKVTLS